MSLLELALLVVAGFAAGSINGAVGSGSLVTLPILLAMGLAPASAVTTNTIAMVLSAFGGVMAYRRELRAELRQIRPLVIISTLSGIVGATLLLTTPPGAIAIVVPVLIVFALLLVAFQPRISRAVQARAQQRRLEHGVERGPFESRGLRVGIAGCALYGGYFAAAQGVILMGVLGAFTGRPLGTVVGIKNLLTLTVNITAALMFTVASLLWTGSVVWSASAAIALGALFGGYAGGRLAKAVPAWVLRGIIIVVAIAALVREIAA